MLTAKYEKIGGAMVRITVEVEAGAFDEAVNEAYRSERVHYQLPGFRKGAAPRKYIEKAYGETIFFGAAADILVAQEYPKALDELKLNVVSRPENLEILQIGLGEAFVFTVETAVKPEAVLGQYKGIEVTGVRPVIDEAEIENALNQLQYEASQQIPVTDRPAEPGDTANIDYVGSINSVPFEGGSAQAQELLLGSGMFIAGFEEQIVGHLPGDEFDIFVTFPENYHAAELSGKPAVFGIKLNSLSITEAPDIDDNFAKNYGMASLEALKAALRESLMEGKVKEARTQTEDAIIDVVLENAEVDFPEAMVKYALEEEYEEFKEKLQKNGLSLQQFLEYSGHTEETYLAEQRPIIVKRLKLRAVLEAVAKAEGIVADDNELEAKLQHMAEQYNMTVDRVKELMGDTEPIRQDMAAEKAFNFIVSSAVIK